LEPSMRQSPDFSKATTLGKWGGLEMTGDLDL
jgi:hypothetical protein